MNTDWMNLKIVAATEVGIHEHRQLLKALDWAFQTGPPKSPATVFCLFQGV
jgi:hypothetical protein